MRKLQVLVLLILGTSYTINAQYTETLNSNRPGESQGAFAVGTGVYQLEAGGFYGNDKHALYKTNTDIYGADYSLRVGVLTDILELNFMGSYQAETTTLRVGGFDEEYKRSNFPTTVIGAKALLYDPYKNAEDKPNLYSWKANQRFKWKKLIPAISVYGGANLNFWDNPYTPEGEGSISPKAAIITQNNWGRWVLVLNFIADKFTEEYSTYQGIATLTHAVTPRFAVFGEFQTIISDLYADDLARAGMAYLLTKNLQVDVSGLVNFKDTPERWQVAGGLSYRLDFHEEQEYSGEATQSEKRRRSRSEKRGFFRRKNKN
ncbi:transporter [Salegentibacter chungangensis]|uniref:Transporter n=1 Tax=Salegentibacter chungangensis TaxID=1335724 RepID=A0ABW3NSP8_9FLAO